MGNTRDRVLPNSIRIACGRNEPPRDAYGLNNWKKALPVIGVE